MQGRIKRIVFLKSMGLVTALVLGQLSADAQSVSMGNGASNSIITDGVIRDGSTLTFKEVVIDGDGWLVMHPFEDGAPNGDKYVATTFLEDGKNSDVEILVHKGVETGERFIVMLHSDSNHNKVLDFIFVDDRNVMDKAVFEGSTMIGHVVAAP